MQSYEKDCRTVGFDQTVPTLRPRRTRSREADVSHLRSRWQLEGTAAVPRLEGTTKG